LFFIDFEVRFGLLECNSISRLQRRIGSLANRLAALFLFEQVGDDVPIRGEANLVALDLGNEAARDVMMLVLVGDSAVRANQLDPIAFDPIDGPEMDPVRTDDFHMFANVFEAAHNLLLSGPGPNAPLALRVQRRRRPTTPVCRMSHPDARLVTPERHD
jgi:hypothetical protein